MKPRFRAYVDGKGRKWPYIKVGEDGSYWVEARREPWGRKRRKADNLNHAKRIARNLETELFGEAPKPKPGLLLVDLFQRYRIEDEVRAPGSANSRRYYEDVLLRGFGEEIAVSALNPSVVAAYQSKLKGWGRKPSTINRHTKHLRRFLEYAVRDGVIPSNPIDGYALLNEGHGRDRVMTWDEENLLRGVMDPEEFDTVILLVETGIRRGRLLSMPLDRIDWNHNLIGVNKAKGGKSRPVPMSDLVREIVKRREEIGTEWLCPNPRRTKHWNANNWYNRVWRVAVKAAGIKDLRPHDLRHTFATRLAETGVTPTTLKELTGHSDLRMLTRYTHLSQGHLQTAIKGLNLRRMPPECHPEGANPDNAGKE